MTTPTLVLIPGDGIGQEVVPEAARVLQAVMPALHLVEAEAGWGAFQRHGVSVPPATLDAIRQAGAALFGAVQSPARKVAGYRSAILTMRQALDLYANVRPVHSLPLPNARPHVNLLIVRENTEGLYVGEETSDGETVTAQRRITRRASARIGRVAAHLARQRLTIVHKANILPVSDGLFRDTVRAVVAETRPDLAVDELLVDVAAYHLARTPERFDTLVAPNLYGDILSDLAAVWCGGLGLAPSINLGDGVAVAEPVHGSAPDIAGKGIANPIAAILSGALLCRYVWRNESAASAIEQAVATALQRGAATPDLGGTLSTREMTDAVLAALGA
ncbi:homoisocitrate dehydrogenase [Ardenticatena maritima]|uniref:Isocitrate dehydrogenase n=1 Tax=Ardenticatena maritima TaxID=872965 RepID=A0A0M8K8B6_9CHLR|nr:isocitrate/isopropylmalate dehydrogenase family protein [Ardenticatena maritima]KPL89095.1 isocitrate dehydrogenase [Ardenticatena maritima]GAP63825.1 homoisocitrate dehydrogenase [Ardenticatena maritima]